MIFNIIFLSIVAVLVYVILKSYFKTGKYDPDLGLFTILVLLHLFIGQMIF